MGYLGIIKSNCFCLHVKEEKMTLLEKIKPEIDKHSVISFDIFDTLLLRPYVKPTDLFLHLERLENAKGFAKARVEAQRKAWEKMKSKDEDINIDEIYAEIADKYKSLKEKEMALEAEVLTANPEMKEVYDYAIKQKKKIVIISDMYLPQNFLHKVLIKQGYKKFRLFVSGERRKRKGNGLLYVYAIKALNILSENVLHIGDNKKSDFDEPKKIGMSVYLYEQVLSRYLKQNEKAKIFLDKYKDNLEASVMIMNFALHWLTNQEEDFWSRIGYEYGGPICYAYMRWVEQQVLEKGIKEILFVARDGYSLQKVFDSFGHKDIKTHYVYAPRQVFINCFVDQCLLDERELFLLKGYSEKDNIIKKAAKKMKDRKEARQFIEKNIEIFKNIEKGERDNYAEYINKLNIGKNACVIDTRSLFISSTKLISYFIGYNAPTFLWSAYKQTLNSDKFDVYAFNQNYSKNNDNIICWDFYEYMMTAPEAPIVAIDKKGVIHQKEIANQERIRIKTYSQISEKILMFNSAISLFEKLSFSEAMVTDWVSMLFLMPRTSEKKHLEATEISGDSDHKIYRKLYTKWKKNLDTMESRISIFKIPIVAFQQVKYIAQSGDNNVKTKIKLLGIPLFKQIKNEWINRKYFLGLKLISSKLKNNIFSLHVLGLPILKTEHIKPKKKTEENVSKIITNNNEVLLDRLNRILERKLSTFFLHQQTFPQFKNINKGKDVVIVATGPSLTQFKPIDNAIYIGVNRAVQYNKVHYDYYFVQDYSGATPQYLDNIYQYKRCVKFIGLTTENTAPERTIPEMYRDGKDMYAYRTDWENIKKFKTKFAYDLATTALGCGGTIVLPAIQFALWTHPKRIYLVGCDTTTSGYFDNKADKANFLNTEKLKGLYQEIKAFAHQYYPDVEIISINPVGLKGIFKDEYQ